MSTPAHIPTIEVAELTIEEEVNLARVRANLTDEHIAALIEEAKKHMAPIESHEQYIKVKEAEKRIAKVRIIGDRNLDAIDRRRIDRNKFEMKMVQEVRAKIHEPELLLASVIAPWEAEVKRKREEEEAAIAAMREERKNTLLALKYVFIPGPPEHRYELEGVGVAMRDIMDDDEVTWNNKMITFRMHGEQVSARIAEEERLRQEEAERLEKQRKEQEEREQELSRREADMKRREEETEAAKEAARKAEVAALENGRLAELSALGIDAQMYYQQHFLGESIQPPLAEYEPMEWPLVVARAKELIGRIVKHEEEVAERARLKKERQDLIESRVKALKEAGWVEAHHPQSNEPQLALSEGGGPFTRVISISELHEEKGYIFNELVDRGGMELARRKQAEEAAEEERKAAMQRILDAQNKPVEQPIADTLTDEALWLQWIDAAPKMSSAIGNHGVSSAVKYLKDMTPGLFRDMKQ